MLGGAVSVGDVVCATDTRLFSQRPDCSGGVKGGELPVRGGVGSCMGARGKCHVSLLMEI